VARAASWGVPTDGRDGAPSYNVGMALTTASTVRPSFHLNRQSVVAFVAGLAVAGTVAIGVDVARADDAAPKTVTHVVTVPAGAPVTLCSPAAGRC
jgi:hypothetical protein